MKNIAILGASGSIGKQTLEVLENLKSEYKLVAFSVGKNIEKANEIIQNFDTIELICVQDEEDVQKVKFPNVVFGSLGLEKVATYASVDTVLTAVVGSVGLMPTIKAIENKKDIALANKETLVMAGHIVMELAKEYNVSILPVDSEHSAIFQCLQGEKSEIESLIITASGGSFRDKTLEELKTVTKEDALQHPNWSMGDKITIDSATMVNKGLEVIEAHHLFNVDYSNIKTVIHKESIVHSMVEFKDGAIIAQLGKPSMKLPIQYALTYPNRKPMENDKLNLEQLTTLNFKPMDYDRFYGLKLAYIAGEKGHTYPTVFNIANEEAVKLFLEDKINFLDITKIIEKQMQIHTVIENPTIDTILEVAKEVKKNINKEFNICQY